MADRCPGCPATVGQPHTAGCDVARCLAYGTQRIQCQPGARMVVRGLLPGGVDVDWEEDGHGCGQDVWTGKWPGVSECEQFGWWAYFVPGGDPSWVRCGPDHPGARPDLNRLAVEADWDATAGRWRQARANADA